MSIPYEMTPLSGIVANGGETRVVAIDFPSRSIISKLVIIQYAGTPGAFSATLFNHPVVLEGQGVSESDSVGDEVGPIPEQCYMVGPVFNGDSNGHLIYFSDFETGGHGLTFFNQETEVHRERGHKRKLYLRLQPSGTGEKKFAICIGGEAYE